MRIFFQIVFLVSLTVRLEASDKLDQFIRSLELPKNQSEVHWQLFDHHTGPLPLDETSVVGFYEFPSPNNEVDTIHLFLRSSLKTLHPSILVMTVQIKKNATAVSNIPIVFPNTNGKYEDSIPFAIISFIHFPKTEKSNHHPDKLVYIGDSGVFELSKSSNSASEVAKLGSYLYPVEIQPMDFTLSATGRTPLAGFRARLKVNGKFPLLKPISPTRVAINDWQALIRKAFLLN